MLRCRACYLSNRNCVFQEDQRCKRCESQKETYRSSAGLPRREPTVLRKVITVEKEDKYQTCRQRNLRYDIVKPCSYCTKRNIECAPYQGRNSGVPLEEKYYYCRQKGFACDGKSPCSKCASTRYKCITQNEQKNYDKVKKAKAQCNGCKNNREVCDGERPCGKCKSKQRICGYYGEDNLVRYKYSTIPANMTKKEEDEYKNCKMFRRQCSGTEPCFRCVKYHDSVCTWVRGNGLTEIYNAKVFTLNDDNEVILKEDADLPITTKEKFRFLKLGLREKSGYQFKRSRKTTEDEEINRSLDEGEDLSPNKDSVEMEISKQKGKGRAKRQFETDESAEDKAGESADYMDEQGLDEDLEPNEKGFIGLVIGTDPLTYGQAMKSDDPEGWRKAIEAEINSLEDNEVFILVPMPKYYKAIPSKWVFRTKTGPDGRMLKRKARLVAKGFRQRLGIDYFETFITVVKPTSFRILFALAA